MLQVTARIQCDYMLSPAQGQRPLDESVRKIPLQVTARIQSDYMPSPAQGQRPLDERVRIIPPTPAPFREEQGLRAR